MALSCCFSVEEGHMESLVDNRFQEANESKCKSWRKIWDHRAVVIGRNMLLFEYHRNPHMSCEVELHLFHERFYLDLELFRWLQLAGLRKENR